MKGKEISNLRKLKTHLEAKLVFIWQQIKLTFRLCAVTARAPITFTPSRIGGRVSKESIYNYMYAYGFHLLFHLQCPELSHLHSLPVQVFIYLHICLFFATALKDGLISLQVTHPISIRASVRFVVSRRPLPSFPPSPSSSSSSSSSLDLVFTTSHLIKDSSSILSKLKISTGSGI